jgi:RNA polymerase sigma-70 factor (ECF subfamily)
VLFKLYYSRLCTYARTFVRIPELAEEIVQETFINFWEKRNEIEIDSSFKSYIFRSVHNNCINNLKKSEVLRRQSEKMAGEILYHNEVAMRNFSPEIIDRLVGEETERKLNMALDELPPEARKIFIMSRFDQLSYAEIAASLDISVNTVKTQMKRTLARLREIFF